MWISQHSHFLDRCSEKYILIRWAVDDHIINPAFSGRAAGETSRSSSSPLKKGVPQPLGGLCPWEELHYIFLFPFHLISYVPWSYLLWVCVTSIFIFKPLGLGADTGWPLFKCLLHSEQISLQQSWWLCTIYLISKLFLCALAAILGYSATLITRT